MQGVSVCGKFCSTFCGGTTPIWVEMNHESDHFQFPILSSSMSKVTPEATSAMHSAYLANLHLFPLNQPWCLPCQSPPVPSQSAMVLTLPISTRSPSISHGAYLANDGAYLANDSTYLANLHLFLLNQPVLAQSHLLLLLLRSLLSLCRPALTGGGAPDTQRPTTLHSATQPCMGLSVDSVPQPYTQQPNPALACLLTHSVPQPYTQHPNPALACPLTHSVPQPYTQQPNPALACLLQLSQLIIVYLNSNKN